jgi:23S rRNA pseudouridine1911/1915/1917 synthase
VRGDPGAPAAGRRLRIDLPLSRRGERLDLALAALLPDQSRAALQRLMREGRVLLAGGPARASYRVRGGERVVVDLPFPPPSTLEPEDRPLDVLHEDADLLVINKPPGMTVHPGAGRRSGTLVNALLHHCRDLSGIGGILRPGIVHRLDRETSGVLVVAKNDAAHRDLSDQFKARTVSKIYEALVWGRPRLSQGTLDAAIGRHPVARTRMALRRSGRAARTAYRLALPLGIVSLLEVQPETGRTHQIRVHLSALGHPVVGDTLYGGARFHEARDRRAREALLAYHGLALHARNLGFHHPRTGVFCAFAAPRPRDRADLIAALAALQGAPAVGP